MASRWTRGLGKLVTGRPIQAFRELTGEADRAREQRRREEERREEERREEERRERRRRQTPTGPSREPGRRLSPRQYHLILAGYGPVWGRPYTRGPAGANFEPWCKDYAINMQGIIRGGTRLHSVDWFESAMESLEPPAVFAGVLSTGEEIDYAEFETDPAAISYYGNIEPDLLGDGWRTQ